MSRTIVITGASSGIGLAIAQRFLLGGCNVFNLDIHAPEHPSAMQTIICDVASESSVKNAISTVLQSSDIDVVISNAGIHLSANIEQTSDHDFERLININVKGAYYLTRSVLSNMREKKQGIILYIGSDQCLVGKQNSFAYNLSKHALASMTKTTALDYAKYNIRVNALCPGTIETPLYHKAIEKYCEKSGANIDDIHQEEAALQPLGRIGKADEVASFAWYLASDEAAFITGALLPIDGGYTAQ